MRRRCVIAVGLVTLAACGSSSGKATSASCGPAGARTLAVDRLARVYQSGGYVYGCAAAGTRSYRLGAAAETIRQSRAGPIALAGVDVAYGLSEFGVDTVSAQVIVRDLRTGAQLRVEPAITHALGAEFFESVAAVVVKPNGAVAWIGRGGSLVRRGSAEIEVNRADARGRALLDSGVGIDAGSLRLRGSTLSWRHGGRVSSAVLR